MMNLPRSILPLASAMAVLGVSVLTGCVGGDGFDEPRRFERVDRYEPPRETVVYRDDRRRDFDRDRRESRRGDDRRYGDRSDDRRDDRRERDDRSRGRDDNQRRQSARDVCPGDSELRNGFCVGVDGNGRRR